MAGKFQGTKNYPDQVGLPGVKPFLFFPLQEFFLKLKVSREGEHGVLDIGERDNIEEV